MTRDLSSNEKKTKTLRIILIVIIAIIVLAEVLLIRAVYPYIKSQREYNDAASSYVSTDDSRGNEWYDMIKVDFDSLLDESPQAVGWIYFENEDISYPIMYSGDNDKYLHTSYNGQELSAGSVFVDGRCNPDFSEPSTIVYGHNMKDLSMFGRLRYYRQDSNYLDEHRYFQIITQDASYRYEIYDYGDVSVSDTIFDIPNATMDPTEHTVVLSTCNANDSERFVVCGKRIDEHR